MKYYLSEIIPRIQQFSKRLDENALLTSNEWVQFNQESLNRVYYIFRKNGELLVTEKGIGKKLQWENLGNGRISIEEESTFYHFRIAFYDGLFLVMNLNDTNDYVFFLNASKTSKEFSTIEQIDAYLNANYSSKPNYLEFNEINFKEDEPILNWNMYYGRHQIITVRFSNGVEGIIYFGYKTKKYFFIKSELDPMAMAYFDNKVECIKEVYEYLTNGLN